jgi:AraC-like DNA-binding protein
MNDFATIPKSGFSTLGMAQKEKFEYWHAGVHEVFDIELLDKSLASEFDAGLESYLMGDIMLIQSFSSPQSYRRMNKHIAMNGVDHILLEIVIQGSYVLEQSPDIKVLHRGDMVLYDLAQENHLITCRDKFNNAPLCKDISAVIPRHLLQPYVQNIERLHQLVLPATSALNRTLRYQLLSLYQMAEQMPIAHAATVSQAFVSVVSGLLSQDEDCKHRMFDRTESHLLLTVFNIIDNNLANHHLNAEFFELALGLTRSSLYRLCAPWGGIANLIRRRRLNQAYKRLVNIDSAGLITEIAYQCGYPNCDSFSRAFKKQFGLRPSDVIRCGFASSITMPQEEVGLDTKYLDWAKSYL